MASGANSSCIAVIGWEPGVVEGGARPCRRGVAGLAGGREPGSRVVRIRSGLVVALVTGEAVCWNRRVIVVHVATGASHCRVFSSQGKWRVVVIERRGDPRRRVVAHIALLRESRLNVVRAGCAVEIVQVTGGAGSAVQAVVTVHVALRTLQWNVRPGQREAGRCVIESRVCPRNCGVTRITGLRKSRLRVIGVSRSLVVLEMASRACAAVQGVVSVYVTLGAR